MNYKITEKSVNVRKSLKYISQKNIKLGKLTMELVKIYVSLYDMIKVHNALNSIA